MGCATDCYEPLSVRMTHRCVDVCHWKQGELQAVCSSGENDQTMTAGTGSGTSGEEALDLGLCPNGHACLPG